MLSTLICFTKYKGNVYFQVAKERGLGFNLAVVRQKCGTQYISSCPYIGTGYKINQRLTLAMRLLGIGFKGVTKFCALMYLPYFVKQTTYKKILDNIYFVPKQIAELYMKKACKEEISQKKLKNLNEKERDLTVTGDGTWHKRGFTSLYGVFSLIGAYTNKFIDIFVKSAYCH